MNKSDAMKQLLEAIEAFTDPEGNMPADTGEFNDLKDCIAPLRAFIAAEEAKPPLSAEREALIKELRELKLSLSDRAAEMLAADARVPMTKAEVDAFWDILTPEGHSRSRYDIVREVEAHHGIAGKP